MVDESIHSDDPRLADWIVRYLDGQLEGDDLRALIATLEVDPAACQMLVDFSLQGKMIAESVEECLAEHLTTNGDRRLATPVERRLRRDDFSSETFRRAVEFIARPTPFSIFVASFIVAAVLMTASFVHLGFSPDGGLTADGDRNAVSQVATLTEVSAETTWGAGQSRPFVGDRISAGSLLLKSGRARIMLDGGASVVLNAPAAIELLDKNSVRLIRGDLTARIQRKTAVGFTVETFAGRFVDLGTEFGVRVADPSVDLFVFEGAVRVEPTFQDGHATIERDFRYVAAGHGLRIDWQAADPVQFVESDGRQFFRRVLTPKSDFTFDAEQWRAASRFPYVKNSGERNSDDGPERWLAATGKSGGVVRDRSGYITTSDALNDRGCYFFAAPTKFLGDQSDAFGRSIQFDFRPRYVDTRQVVTESVGTERFTREAYPCVLIRGETTTLGMFWADRPELEEWSHLRFPLDETGGWMVMDSKNVTVALRRANEKDIRETLGSVRSLHIRGELTSGKDEADLDNVTLGE